MRAASLLWLWLLVPAWLLSACTEQEKVTAIVLVIDSDMKDTLTRVTVDVDHFSNRQLVGADLGGAVQLPKRVGLVHRGGPPGPITITVQGFFKDGTEAVVTRLARVYFVPNKIMMLRVDLLQQCSVDGYYYNMCGPTQTCGNLGCRSPDVPANELTPWVGEIPPWDAGVSPNSGIDSGVDSSVEMLDSSMSFDASDRDTAVSEPDTGVDAGEPMCTCPGLGFEHIDGRSCATGRCRITCAQNFDNCDDKVGNGCETSLKDDVDHCGECDISCPVMGTFNIVGRSCDNGTCKIECDKVEHDDCDKNGLSCEANLLTSEKNCGACGTKCPLPGENNIEQSSCIDGACEIDSCEPGFGDCDGVLDCERDIRDPDPLDDTMGGLGPCVPDSGCTFVHNPIMDGHDYYFCNTPRTYDDARIKCQAQRFGDLVRIDDDGENSFVKLHMTLLSADAWIGASDANREGVWRQSDTTLQFWNGGPGGGIVDNLYSRWSTGEPSIAGGGEDCARMSKSASMAVWSAYNCGVDDKAPFVCEIQADDCDTDPTKHHDMQCGCGLSDADSDADGVADCHDDCPQDPLKTVVGSCTCGVADVNTDGDSALDCAETCDSDPDKLEPGLCGCGVPDTDTDGDLEPDCLDDCPDDPNKTESGLCGCGTADDDTDGDTVEDCHDLCPADPNKSDLGTCGCGVSDMDTDGDTFADCIENCDGDPNKQDPGLCNCGTADTNTDGDAEPDCNDECVDDPDKVLAGTCGCGVAEQLDDSDGDGVPLCFDLCPADSNKAASMGQCGCGVPDVETDTDGVADCNDACDYDSAHTSLPCAYSFTPSNVTASANLFDAATDVTCSTAGTLTFDTTITTMQTVCGVSIVPVIQVQTGGPELWILPMNSLSVAAGVTLRFSGTRPVVLAVANDATINGTIDVGAQNTVSTSTPGAGGNVSCGVGTGQGGNGVYNGSSNKGDGAGGGGGFGTVGGAGGAGNKGGAAGGAGVASVDTDLSPLRGGCSGGATATNGNVSGGGAGGGAVELSVGGKLTLGSSAVITAAGGGGLKGPSQESAGGGGGSGGAVFLEGKLLSIAPAAWVVANGGGGAGGNATSNTSGTGGSNGSNGSKASASGGSGGNDGGNDSDGGGGGLGAAAQGGATAGGNGTTAVCNILVFCGDDGGGGGGGGGGVGRVRVHSITAPCSGPTNASPAATTVCP